MFLTKSFAIANNGIIDNFKISLVTPDTKSNLTNLKSVTPFRNAKRLGTKNRSNFVHQYSFLGSWENLYNANSYFYLTMNLKFVWFDTPAQSAILSVFTPTFMLLSIQFLFYSYRERRQLKTQLSNVDIYIHHNYLYTNNLTNASNKLNNIYIYINRLLSDFSLYDFENKALSYVLWV